MDGKHICTALLLVLPFIWLEICLCLELQRVCVSVCNRITLYIFSMFYKRLDDENKRNFFSSHEPECIAKHCQILYCQFPSPPPPPAIHHKMANGRPRRRARREKSGDACKKQESVHKQTSMPYNIENANVRKLVFFFLTFKILFVFHFRGFYMFVHFS